MSTIIYSTALAGGDLINLAVKIKDVLTKPKRGRKVKGKEDMAFLTRLLHIPLMNRFTKFTLDYGMFPELADDIDQVSMWLKRATISLAEKDGKELDEMLNLLTVTHPKAFTTFVKNNMKASAIMCRHYSFVHLFLTLYSWYLANGPFQDIDENPILAFKKQYRPATSDSLLPFDNYYIQGVKDREHKVESVTDVDLEDTNGRPPVTLSVFATFMFKPMEGADSTRLEAASAFRRDLADSDIHPLVPYPTIDTAQPENEQTSGKRKRRTPKTTQDASPGNEDTGKRARSKTGGAETPPPNTRGSEDNDNDNVTDASDTEETDDFHSLIRLGLAIKNNKEIEKQYINAVTTLFNEDSDNDNLKTIESITENYVEDGEHGVKLLWTHEKATRKLSPKERFEKNWSILENDGISNNKILELMAWPHLCDQLPDLVVNRSPTDWIFIRCDNAKAVADKMQEDAMESNDTWVSVLAAKVGKVSMNGWTQSVTLHTTHDKEEFIILCKKDTWNTLDALNDAMAKEKTNNEEHHDQSKNDDNDKLHANEPSNANAPSANELQATATPQRKGKKTNADTPTRHSDRKKFGKGPSRYGYDGKS